MTIKYPNINVKLVGEDGNAFAILGRVQGALRSAGVPPETVKAFLDEATSGDYDKLLRTCMEWVGCDGGDDGDENEFEFDDDYEDEEDDE